MELSSNVAVSVVGQVPLLLSGGEMFSDVPKAPKRKKTPIRDLLKKRKVDLSLPLFDFFSGIDPGTVATLSDTEMEADDAVTGLCVESLSYMDNAPHEIEQEDVLTPWTDDGMLQLHGVLLEESLKALAARGNAKQKGEILRWIFRSDLIATPQETGGPAIYASMVPWTFAMCCKMEGFNPDVIRDFIRSRIERA